MRIRPAARRVTGAVSVLGVLLVVPVIGVLPAFAADPDQVQMTLEGCKLPDLATSCVYPTDFTTGSLGKNWAELDLVPHRLTLHNNGAAQTFDILLSSDHLLGGVKGYDFHTLPTSTGAGCSMTVSDRNIVSPTGVVGGVDKVLTTKLTVTMAVDATCAISYAERLALGSHLYSGASLQSQVLNADYSSAGQRTVSIPVNEIAPQEISKTAAAFVSPTNTWTVTKSGPTDALNIDSCDPAATAPNLTYTVSYSKTLVPGLADTVSGSITVTNPSNRSLVASITDTVKLNGNPVGGGTLPDVTVPANGSAVVPYSFVITPGAGTLTNTAMATYHDPDNPGVDLAPLSVTVAAPVDVTQLPATAATAVITDTETASSGLLYKRTSPQATADFVSTDSFTTTVSATGSFSVNKIVKAAQPGNFDGTLLNAVSLLPDGASQPLTAQVSVPIHVTADDPTLTVNKFVDVAPASDATFTFTINNDQTGADTPVSVTVLAGQLSGSNTVSVAPSNAGYTLTEGTPPTGYDTAAPVQTTALGFCDVGSVRIDDTRSRAALTITKAISGDDPPPAGFVFSVSCEDGTTATVTFHAAGSQQVTGIQTGTLCHVTETPVLGWTSSPSGVQDVTVTTQGATVAFTNTRNTAALSITKAVVGDDPPPAGFTFSVVCTDGTNETVTFTAAGTQSVDGILTGSSCDVTETAVPGWRAEPTGTQTVVVGENGGTVSFTNIRNVGSVSVTKTITGDDPPPAGFEFSVECDDGTNETLTFNQAGSQSVGGILAGSVCTVTETPVAGWTSTPAGAQEVTPGLADGSVASVSFANVRNLASVAVTKAIVGDVAPPAGFTFTVVCDDGTEETLVFGAAGTQTVDGILSGSTCTVTETALEGWTSTPAGPQEIVLGLEDGSVGSLEFVNTRQPAALELVKTVDLAQAEYGDTLTYGLTVTNIGQRPLHGVEVSDDVPDNTTYVAGSATCPAPCTASYDAAKNTVHFQIGDLAPGASYGDMEFKVVITIPAAADDGAIPSTVILNSATTSSPPDIVEPVPSNEVRTIVVAVLGVKLELPETGSRTPIPQSLALALGLLLGGANLMAAGAWRARLQRAREEEQE